MTVINYQPQKDQTFDFVPHGFRLRYVTSTGLTEYILRRHAGGVGLFENTLYVMSSQQLIHFV